MDFSSLSKLFTTGKGLYLLGAGASYPYVLSGEKFEKDVLRHTAQLDNWPAMPEPPSSQRQERFIKTYISNRARLGLDPKDAERFVQLLNSEEEISAYRFLGTVAKAEITIEDELALRATSGAVVVADRLVLKGLNDGPPRVRNYCIFNHFYPGHILNYNLDGLLDSASVRRHVVYHPHGNGELVSLSVPVLTEVMQDAQLYDLKIGSEDVMLEPEKNEAHSYFPRSLQGYDFVGVVGYTFGRRSDGLDDWRSYLTLLDRLDRCPIPVYVFDIWPEPLCQKLKSDLGRRTAIREVEVSWHKFASQFYRWPALDST